MFADAISGGATSGSPRLAGSTFWRTTRRVVVCAAGVDLGYFLLFHLLGAPQLAWLSVAGVAVYALVWWMLRQRINRPALALIWLEVLAHAVAGTLIVGWDSGFHYYLLMFIPAIVVSSSARTAAVLVALLLACYLGLDVAYQALDAPASLSTDGVQAVKWFNIVIVFLMFSALGRFYVGMVARSEQRLHLLGTRDPLTGLFNRRHFQAMADHVVAHGRRSAETVSLVVADVDQFERINGEHGHDAGGKVLLRVAELMRHAFREQDILARWAGEEFLVLLPDTDGSGALAAAERMRRAAETATVLHRGHAIRFTLSFGFTTMEGDESLADALTRADHALVASKNAGRNRVSRE